MSAIVRTYTRLKENLSKLRHGQPGTRFIDHYQRHRAKEKNEGKWKTVAYIVGGAVLLIGGLLLSIPPGLPGFLLWIPALGLLVARLKMFARFMDRTELFARRIVHKVRK